MPKVSHQLEAEESGGSSGDVGIAGEISVNLNREGENTGPEDRSYMGKCRSEAHWREYRRDNRWREWLKVHQTGTARDRLLCQARDGRPGVAEDGREEA